MFIDKLGSKILKGSRWLSTEKKTIYFSSNFWRNGSIPFKISGGIGLWVCFHQKWRFFIIFDFDHPYIEKTCNFGRFCPQIGMLDQHFVTVTPLKMAKTKIPSQHSGIHTNSCGLRGVSLKNREAVFSVLPNLAEICVLNQRDPFKDRSPSRTTHSANSIHTENWNSLETSTKRIFSSFSIPLPPKTVQNAQKQCFCLKSSVITGFP